jgi:hypothetical protein
VSICHCYACQKRTGSAFGVQARFAEEQVVAIGHASVYEREGDSGGVASFRFCPHCGTTVWWQIDKLPGFTSVAVGAFADGSFPAPTAAVYEARQVAWVEIRPEDPEAFVHWD